MDSRLLKASQKGDVQHLLSLIEDDPLILHSVSLGGCENPLHIACTAGHLNFVREIIKLRREFAYEVNKDGFTPLHIGSANGDLEIVRELLKLDRNLCLIKGKNRGIPIHFASVKGRIDVISELLSSDENCIEDVTSRGETALHLATKNNQFDALEILVKHLKQFNKEQVLNMKDYDGNTVLHLAVSRKQLEVLKLVLDEKIVKKGVLDMNSLNKDHQRPLDVLKEDDREIEDILRQSGAIKTDDFHYTDNPTRSSRSRTRPRCGQWIDNFKSDRIEQWMHYFKHDMNKDSPNEVRNALLVVATLITTITYQAGLSPPMGVWQDDLVPTNGTFKSHEAGNSVMASKGMLVYGLFLVFNSVGFYFSLVLIVFLTLVFPLPFELRVLFRVSLGALFATYSACMCAISPNSRISTFVTAFSILMPSTMMILIFLVRWIIILRRN